MHIKFVCVQLLQDMDKKGNEVKKAEVDYFRSQLEAKTVVSEAKRNFFVACLLHVPYMFAASCTSDITSHQSVICMTITDCVYVSCRSWMRFKESSRPYK